MSEWGHDFRPDYLRLATVIAELGHPPTMACTATATPKVAEEIVARLGLREPERVRSGFDRPNLSFDVLKFDGEGSVARKRATLVAGIQMPENRPAIVYCGTRKSTEETAELLRSNGLNVAGYHAGMPADTRTAAQDAFMRGEADVVVATNAFGMGVDKADVRSVWHWALPSSLEAYYQEAGRAGRDGQPGRAVLLASRSDLGRLVRFINEAEVTVEQVAAIVNRPATRSSTPTTIATAWRSRWPSAPAPSSSPRRPAAASMSRSCGRLDRSRTAQLCKAAKDRRWQSYRSIERYSSSEECRRRQLLDHFGDRDAGRAARPLLRRPRPAGLAPADHAVGQEGAGAGRGRPAGLRRRAGAAEGLAARARGRQARLHRGDRRDAPGCGAPRPKTPQELLAIKGIGPSFVEKHADSLLELLDRAVR